MMLNKSVMLMSGLVFGLSIGSGVYAGKPSKNDELDYKYRGPINKYFKVVATGKKTNPAQKDRVRATTTNAKPIPNTYRDANPNSKHLKSSDKAWLLKKMPSVY